MDFGDIKDAVQAAASTSSITTTSTRSTGSRTRRARTSPRWIWDRLRPQLPGPRAGRRARDVHVGLRVRGRLGGEVNPVARRRTGGRSEPARRPRRARSTRSGSPASGCPFASLDPGGTRSRRSRRIAMTVELDAGAKGTHMSRFVEVLGSHSGDLDRTAARRRWPRDPDAPRDRDGAESVSTSRTSSTRSAPDHGRLAPRRVHGAPCTSRPATTSRSASASSVPVASLCPCSKEISDYGAHNQRGYVDIDVVCADGRDRVDRGSHRRGRGRRVGAALRAAQAPGRALRDDAGLRESGVRRGHRPRRGGGAA